MQPSCPATGQIRFANPYVTGTNDEYKSMVFCERCQGWHSRERSRTPDAASGHVLAAEFARVADAIRQSFEPAGYLVHVNTNRTQIQIQDVLKVRTHALELTVRERRVLP